MPQIFHRSANTLANVSIVGGVLLAGGLIGLIMIFGRSSYVTRASEFIEQPLQFSHAHLWETRYRLPPLMLQPNSLHMEWCLTTDPSFGNTYHGAMRALDPLPSLWIRSPRQSMEFRRPLRRILWGSWMRQHSSIADSRPGQLASSAAES